MNKILLPYLSKEGISTFLIEQPEVLIKKHILQPDELTFGLDKIKFADFCHKDLYDPSLGSQAITTYNYLSLKEMLNKTDLELLPKYLDITKDLALLKNPVKEQNILVEMKRYRDFLNIAMFFLTLNISESTFYLEEETNRLCHEFPLYTKRIQAFFSLAYDNYHAWPSVNEIFDATYPYTKNKFPFKRLKTDNK